MKLSSVRALKAELFTTPGTVFDETPPSRVASFRARTRPAKRQLGAIYADLDFDELTIGTLGKLAGLGNVQALAARAVVHKVGRTTGQTRGRITAFDTDRLLVDYGIGQLSFDGQIEIEGTGTSRFSDSGDSGSMIVDSRRRAIGLLFAGGDTGGSNNKGLTYANPTAAVLVALNVDLCH